MTKGTRPGHLPAASKTEGEARVCAHPRCQTKLSIYNLGDLCWQHAEIVFPNYRGKRLEPRS
jgi:hypothetical protein